MGIRIRLVICILFVNLVHSERILVLTPVSTPSHKFSLMPIVEALAVKGHQLIVVSPFEPRETIVNVTEIVIKSVYADAYDDWFNIHRESIGTLIFSILGNFRDMQIAGYDSLMSNKEFRSVLDHGRVDLVIIDSILNDMTLPIIDTLDVPFIFHVSSSLVPWTSVAMGLLPDYATLPVVISGMTDEMTFFERVVNVLVSESFRILRYMYVNRVLDEYVKKDFAKARLIAEIEQDASLCISTDHPTISWPRPLPPNIIPIAGLHTRPGKPLPQELQNFADSSTDGFIVFSLGSSIPVSSMPDDVRDIFRNVFSRIPQRVVWKWEEPYKMGTIPPNVYLSDWIPQQDLLAHPNTRLLISHGGSLGIQEAIYHQIPMLGLPFANDQRSNLAKAQKEGYALALEWGHLSEELLLAAINTLITDPNFRANASRLSKLARDNLLPGKDQAVYWIEHVLRHKGAKHLELPSRHMPVYHQYLLDVWLFLAAITTFAGFLSLRIVKLVVRYLNNVRKHKPE